jgi:hypothetical protein
MKIVIRKAERKRAKLRLALCGPSGAGKTYSAIDIAVGLGGKIGMIDTENGSGDLYADRADYSITELGPPYTPARYIEIIKEYEADGFNILIIDSLTHAWAGEGGILDMADAASKAMKSGNSFAAWRHITPEHNKLVNAILQSKMHIIATIRAKPDYDTSKDDKGKTVIQKLGLAPIQREGIDYEFTTVLDLSIDGHIAKASKDRTGIFDGKFITPSPETGKILLEWLNSGSDKPSFEETMRKGLQEADTLEVLQGRFGELWKTYKDDKAMQDELQTIYQQRKLTLTAIHGG